MSEFEHNWDESNVEETFLYESRPGVVVKHPTLGHFCGYTKTSLPSVLHKDITYSGEENYVKLIEVHGGITYGRDSDGWVGFDCGHAGDVCIDEGEVTNEIGVISAEKEWRVEDVVEEVKALADQLSALEQYIERNCMDFNAYE